MQSQIQIRRRNGEKNLDPLLLIPDFSFPGRTLYAEPFESSYSVRIVELPTDKIQVDFPEYQTWIETISHEIVASKQKVKLIGEGLFSGMVFDLLQRHSSKIESASVLNPPFFKPEESFPWLPKNVDWILERFPWNPWFLLSRELHSFYDSMERSFQVGLNDSEFFPAIVFTKKSEPITKQIRSFGKTLGKFSVFRIEASDPKSVQPILKNLFMKILAGRPISSVQKKSKFKIEPGF
ncbi:hypothetical protein [Leptospira sanjuanensis]|uniref:hypothetical protein n=1 Tax=Leptospira sanjuanensis TaxID=2879643 RepID=UPI001EE9648A|nr:hypothetical protein [Leptospira sanjuanensis]MCG6167991.1 hypothetical protein [Leptospira sanjuanensis]